VTETKPKERDWVGLFFFAVEILCVILALIGVWVIYWPAAYIIGGVLGTLAMERIQAEHKAAQRRTAPRRLERVS
jgi:hypothetical protein